MNNPYRYNDVSKVGKILYDESVDKVGIYKGYEINSLTYSSAIALGDIECGKSWKHYGYNQKRTVRIF